VDVDEDGGLEEQAVAPALPAGQDAGAPGPGVVDMGLDDGQLGGGGDGAHLAGELAGPVHTDPQGPDVGRDLGDELVVDGGLDVDPFDGDAGLAGVEHRAPHRGRRRPVDVGVGQDDHGVLAAQFEASGYQP